MTKTEYKFTKIKTAYETVQLARAIKYDRERKEFVKTYARLNPQLGMRGAIENIKFGISYFAKNSNDERRLAKRYKFLWRQDFI